MQTGQRAVDGSERSKAYTMVQFRDQQHRGSEDCSRSDHCIVQRAAESSKVS